jgi:hypothetical protein
VPRPVSARLAERQLERLVAQEREELLLRGRPLEHAAEVRLDRLSVVVAGIELDAGAVVADLEVLHAVDLGDALGDGDCLLLEGGLVVLVIHGDLVRTEVAVVADDDRVVDRRLRLGLVERGGWGLDAPLGKESLLRGSPVHCFLHNGCDCLLVGHVVEELDLDVVACDEAAGHPVVFHDLATDRHDLFAVHVFVPLAVFSQTGDAGVELEETRELAHRACPFLNPTRQYTPTPYQDRCALIINTQSEMPGQ